MSIADDVRAAATEVSSAPATEVVPSSASSTGTGNQSPEPSGTTGTSGRARDESGRFAPKEGGQPEQKVAPGPPKPPEAPATSAAPAKKFAPPQSFRPTVRDFWEKTPLEVQEEIHRVEATTRTIVQQSAQARKQAEQWERTLAPYKAHIQGDPAQWADGVFRTAVQLQTAPPAQRAALVAEIIRSYGVDIRALDEALTAPGAAPQHHQQAPAYDPYQEKFAALEARLQEMQYAPMLNSFLQEAEFIDEPMPDGNGTVRDMVALNLRVAAQQGLKLDLKGAYNLVVAQHPTIQEALKQRADAKAQAERNAQTARAQAASTSVRTEPVVSAPVMSSGTPLDDVRASVAMLRKK